MEDPSFTTTQEGLRHLPPGFRFHPTDEEVIYYLSRKVKDRSFSTEAIGEVDLNRCEPWELPSKAKRGEKEWYFFCHKDRKYPTGIRTNRATESGYWKATGKDKEIYNGKGRLVGMKKTLVFYTGRAPKGEKTNWVMHEFRLEGETSSHLPKAEKDAWVVCRVSHKKAESKTKSSGPDKMIRTSSPSSQDHFYLDPPFPTLADSPYLADIGRGSFMGVPTHMSMDNHQHPHGIGTTTNTFSNSYHQENLHGTSFLPNSSYHLQFSSAATFIPTPRTVNASYLHPADGNNGFINGSRASPLRWQCKEEQYSRESLVTAGEITASPAVSNDRSADVSSAVAMVPEMPNSPAYDEYLTFILSSIGSYDDFDFFND